MKHGPIMPGQIRLILAITAVHLVAWFAYYGSLAIGRVPSAEEAMVLQQALALASGTLDSAAGYSFYEWILALVARFLSGEDGLLLSGRLLNGAAMLTVAGFSAAAAGRLWHKNRAVWISGLLVALNPMLVFWATDLSPTLLATACLAFAAWRSMPWLRHPKPLDSLSIALALSLGVALQPALLGLALVWPLAACLYPGKRRAQHLVLSAAPLGAIATWATVSGLQLQSPSINGLDEVLRQLYLLFNNAEFHPGKSFSLHNRSELILFLNPIHWGFLLICAALGTYARIKNGHRGRSLYWMLAAVALYALGFSLLEGTARDRMAIVPLLAIPAAGVGYLPQIWLHAGRRTRQTLVLGTLLLAALTYSNLFDLRNRQQLIDDYTHLARAKLALGLERGAETWARTALELEPGRQDMEYVLARAAFNEWALTGEPRSLPVEEVRNFLEDLRAIGSESARVEVIEAIYLWKLRQHEAAEQIWMRHRDDAPLATLCLYWLGKIPAPDAEALATFPEDTDRALLEAALHVDRNAVGYSETEKLVDNILAYAY